MDVAKLLDDLCVQLGYCLPPDDKQRIVANPPRTVDAFTDEVIRVEGRDSVLMERSDRRQLRDVVADEFGEPVWPRRRRRS